MTIRLRLICPLLVLLAFAVCTALAQQTRYPFNAPNLPADKRIDNLLSLMTAEEKIDVLGNADGGVAAGCAEHRQLRRGFTAWCSARRVTGRAADHDDAVPAAAGDGGVVGSGVGAPGGRSTGLRGAVHHADGEVQPANADAVGTAVGSGPRSAVGHGAKRFTARIRSSTARWRWRSPEGCRADDPKYWQAAALLKHFLANENENYRTRSSSDFDERLFWEYYSVPFRMAFLEGGAKGGDGLVQRVERHDRWR